MTVLAVLVGLHSTAQSEVICEGRYGGHLQGIAGDADGSLYWSFTVDLVKTDASGKVLVHVEAPSHQGDLCYVNGMVYVAMNLGAFNQEAGKADSWIYAYDAKDLRLVWKKPVPEAVHGAGGMAVKDGHFFVVGGLPGDHEQNYVYEYDADVRFVERHEIDSGQTFLGIQTACFAEGAWWFGCYGKPAELLKTDADFNLIARSEFDCALGVMPGPDKTLLIGRALPVEDKRHGGKILRARPTADDSLTLAE
jgi:hypothetical protein